ncbi:dicer-like 1 [Striga asiatica]|uniref:Dicer-like 1 n=1 Tax=Striga asiatica TaxID=4170 RepID=A0A5A7Q081_STRAF|nr:dicer-like 1 [Striga asiatica]
MHCASVSIRLLGKVIAVCQAVEGSLPGFRFKADSIAYAKLKEESFAFLRGMLLLFVNRWYGDRSSSKGRTGPKCTQRSEVSVSNRVIGESTRSETAKKGNRKQQRKEGKSIGTQRKNPQGCEKLFRT